MTHQVLMEAILTGGRPTYEELATAINEPIEDRPGRTRAVPEDLHLEIKSTGFLDDSAPRRSQDPKRWRERIRKYIAGFANARGGMLVIGYEEPERGPNGRPTGPWQEDRVSTHYEEADIERLCARLGIFPPPVARWVPHTDGGGFLIVATSASPSIIACDENKGAEPRYYLRSADQTVALPAFHIADILLGRKAQPVVEVAPGIAVDSEGTLSLQGVHITNNSLVWMEDVRCGLVYMGDVDEMKTTRIRQAPSSLRQQVRPTFVWHSANTLMHAPLTRSADRKQAPFSLSPFDTNGVGFPDDPMVIVEPMVGRGRWYAGLYVVSRGHLPQWWQVEYNPRALDRPPWGAWRLDRVDVPEVGIRGPGLAPDPYEPPHEEA